MKFLRKYTHIANTQHFCNYCCRYIQSGEQYEGLVYASDKNGIIVFKQHVNPACDGPDDEWESIEAKSRNLEETVKEDVSSNIAA